MRCRGHVLSLPPGHPSLKIPTKLDDIPRGVWLVTLKQPLALAHDRKYWRDRTELVGSTCIEAQVLGIREDLLIWYQVTSGIGIRNFSFFLINHLILGKSMLLEIRLVWFLSYIFM